ncbi:MAG: hypothetical protein U5J95_07200 [Balneolaceae bacterium]|nr:hypothetical protein [Balneolaceae bacterium]
MFEDLDLEKLQTKLDITEIACHLYVKNNGSFTFKDIAKELELDPAEIFDYFPNKKAVLQFYYASLVIRYRFMIEEIDDFETYSLSEKLSNFTYASFDMMKEQQEFVEATFKSEVVHNFSTTGYEKYIEQMLRHFFRNDTRISASSSLVMRPLFFQLLRKKYLYLINFWLDDDSEGKELTMELTDKLTAMIQEIMYSPVVDKGFELIKFLVTNGIITRNIPFWDTITSKIEIRD